LDRQKFFAAVRTSVFGGSLSQAQVDGVSALLDACADAAVTDLRAVAYVLATPVIETGGKFTPISENLNYSPTGLRKTFPRYFSVVQAAQYAGKPERIANRAYASRMANGNEASGDGWKFRGRGFCQITGRENYTRFAKLLNLDLVGNPDLALEPETAAKIMVLGMRDGLFTSYHLADFFNAKQTDWVGARRIINSLDRAADIARYAKAFNAALEGAK